MTDMRVGVKLPSQLFAFGPVEATGRGFFMGLPAAGELGAVLSGRRQDTMPDASYA